MKKNTAIVIALAIITVASLLYVVSLKSITPSAIINNGVPTACESTNKETLKIKATQIEADISRYSTATKDIFGKSAEGGQQTNYVLDGKNVLVKQVFYGETGKSEISYFLGNGIVFYFEKRNTEYVVPLSQDPSGAVRSVELNEFFVDDKRNLCSWYSNGQKQPNTKAAQDTVNFLVSDL